VEFGMYDAITSFAYADPDHGLAVGNNNILITSDGGYNWNRVNDRFTRIGFFDEMNGWIIPEQMNKNLLHSVDGGFTWNEVEIGHSGYPVELAFPDDLVGYVATTESQLLKTTDAGENWEIIDLPFQGYFPTDLQFLDQNTGFICDYPNTIFKTTDGGLTWEEHQVDTLSSLTACDFINPMVGWVVGGDGVCGKTTDGGQSWSFVNLGDENLKEIKFLDQNNGIITSQFRVFRTSDGGANWQRLDLFLNQPQNIEFSDPMNGWITDRVNVYRTYDGGWTWTDSLNFESDNYQDELTDFFLKDTSHAWICTMDGRIFSLSLFQGTEDINAPELFSIYPNPVSNIVTIEVSRAIKENMMICIFSVDGKLLLKGQFSAQNSNKLTLDLSGFSQGLYILNIKGQSISNSFKLLKD
jgi:photosystem II stability/assembly factor-like uncharacterized protein